MVLSAEDLEAPPKNTALAADARWRRTLIVAEEGPMISFAGEVRRAGWDSINNWGPWRRTGWAPLLPVLTFSDGKVEKTATEWETKALTGNEAQISLAALLLTKCQVTHTAVAREDEQAFWVAKLYWIRTSVEVQVVTAVMPDGICPSVSSGFGLIPAVDVIVQ